jgi:DNA-binding MarR family transcriptional regulator
MSDTSPAPVPLSGEQEAVMRAFGRVMTVLYRKLDADLERYQRMSLSEYTVLRILSETETRHMRMSELAAACDMSLSGMTRLAAKLESAGFLERRPCPSDARGYNAVLTDAGFARLQEAWPTHLASVRRHLFDHLDDIDLCRLAKALAKIADS